MDYECAPRWRSPAGRAAPAAGRADGVAHPLPALTAAVEDAVLELDTRLGRHGLTDELACPPLCST